MPLKSMEGDAEPEVGIQSGKKVYRPSLTSALAKAFGLTFLFGSLLKFVYDVLIFVSPMLLRWVHCLECVSRVSYYHSYEGHFSGMVVRTRHGKLICGFNFILPILNIERG